MRRRSTGGAGARRPIAAIAAAFGVLWATWLVPLIHRLDHERAHGAERPAATREHERAHERGHHHGHEHGAGHGHEHARAPESPAPRDDDRDHRDPRHGDGTVAHGTLAIDVLPAFVVLDVGLALAFELEARPPAAAAPRRVLAAHGARAPPCARSAA
jgi:hypothetical protein